MEKFLKAVSAVNDETRVKILKFLNMNSETCVCELETSFEMIQSRLSRHLKILKDSGFLKVRREGRWAYYSIDENMDQFSKEILDEVASLDVDIPISRGSCDK